MTNGCRINRRQFITRAVGTALGAFSFPYIVPSSVLGQAGGAAPSNRITMGCIGVGWQGGSNLGSLLREKDCRVITICDVDKNHLRDAANRVNGRYKSEDCATYADFRDLLAHRSAAPGHPGQITMLLGRKIRFNPDTEEILNDPTAASLPGKAMRSPWHL